MLSIESLGLRTVRNLLDEAGFWVFLLPLIEISDAFIQLFCSPVSFFLSHPGHLFMGAFHSSDLDVQATRLLVILYLCFSKTPL